MEQHALEDWEKFRGFFWRIVLRRNTKVKESTRIEERRCRKDFVFGGENCLEEEHRGRD